MSVTVKIMNEIKNIKCRTDEKCLESIENICQHLDVTPKKIRYISRIFDLYSGTLNERVQKNLKIYYNNLLFQLEHEKKIIEKVKRKMLKISFGSAFPEVNNMILSFI